MPETRLGPAGGQGGTPFETYTVPAEARITEIHLFTNTYIDALQVVYVDAQGETQTLPRVGGMGGDRVVFRLRDGEYLTGISGHTGWYVDAVRFHTNQRISPTYGGSDGSEDFAFKAADNQEVAGFFGRAGWYLDALGLVMRPRAEEAPPEAPITIDAQKGATGPSPKAPTKRQPTKKAASKTTKKTPNERTPAEKKAKKASRKAAKTTAREATTAGPSKEPQPKELQKIEGIGPKTADVLIQRGILDLEDLASTRVARLREILDDAGPRYRMADPETWREQAKLGAKGQWEKLVAMQGELKGGRKKKKQ